VTTRRSASVGVSTTRAMPSAELFAE